MNDYNFYYYYYGRVDSTQEPLLRIMAPSRYHAAILFAKLKRLSLKEFLKIYAVSR